MAVSILKAVDVAMDIVLLTIGLAQVAAVAVATVEVVAVEMVLGTTADTGQVVDQAGAVQFVSYGRVIQDNSQVHA